MARAPSLPEARHWFAEELRAAGHVGDERVLEAFAAGPREIKSLRRCSCEPAKTFWLYGKGWCLSRQELH
jgi:hypothetical protein